jgi:predicted regulator of Ras-like GTPase activity (Roadblock/LC7/MglB family)
LTATSAAPAPAPELEADSPASIASDQLIDLGLAAVLRSMPAPALEISPSAVYEDVRISLPFHLIEPQLSHGRVTVPLNVFTEALPEAYRNVLAADSGLTEVPIPLQEVFRNLPANALSMREDQVVEETGPMFPTPFSQKAEEDAQRFSPPPTPAPVPVVSLKPAAVEPPPAPEPPPVVEEPIEEPVADRTAPVAPSQEEEPAAPESQPPVVAEEPPAPVHEPEPLSEIPTPDHDESITNQPDADSPVETPAEEPAAASAGIELPPLPAQEPEEAPQAELAPAPSFVEEPVIEPPQDHQISAQPEPEPAAASEALAPTEPSDLSAPPSVIELPQLSVPAEDTTSQKEAEAPAVSESAEIAESARIVEESFAPDVEAKKEEIAAPSPEPVESPAPVPPILRDLPEASAPVAVREKDTELQVLFMTEDELDAKTIVRLVGQLPGIESCAVMFSDGLLLAGNAGQGADNEGFSAMAPPFYQRSINFTKELALGQLQALTLYTDQGLLSFFMHENICLSVQHAGRGFLPGVREKLSVVTRELAKMYSSDKPAASEQLSQD